MLHLNDKKGNVAGKSTTTAKKHGMRWCGVPKGSSGGLSHASSTKKEDM